MTRFLSKLVKQLLFLLFFIFALVIIWCISFRSCMKCTWREGLQTLWSDSMGSEIDGSVHHAKSCDSKWTDFVWSTPDKDANVTQLVSPDESMMFLSKTEKRPDCCRDTCGLRKEHQEDRIGISKTSGCPCHSNEQIRFIRTHGGNRTPPVSQSFIGREDNIMD